ncbi:hypothetical protein SMY43_002100 [Cronobacter sakazakii]|uniref:hypothetical protein n=1 Tax=Cronobacter sakazakii TaxID=28141 RepID=UPI002895467F|nr:hypothetical protein [Cronobacter sakazakii]ELY4033976.1 hypothetical protein [Cronobacter sakazakii]MDT3611982.1 hypothetical protein [Cronobacter sakazakii]
MSELKPGGIALVIGGHKNTVLIGRTVELVNLVAAESWVRIPGQPLFFNEEAARWLISKPGLNTSLSNGATVQGYGLIFSTHLMPIDGEDFSKEDERQKELTNG